MISIKKLLLSLSATVIFTGFWAEARNPASLEKIERIKDNTEEFIFGEGCGGDREEAYDAAVHDLVRKISITVQGSTRSEVQDGVGTDGKSLYSEQFKSVVESYTTPASLEGLQVIDMGDDSECRVFVYMPKGMVERMHTRRRMNVADLARSGINSRNKGKVDDALRHLYRAYVLLQSLPSPSEVVETIDGEKRVLANWIPEAMRDIIGGVSFGIASVTVDETDPDNAGKNVELRVTYNGQPATTCTFKYGTASGYSSLVTARDGMAQIELSPSVPLNPLKLFVEYQFKNENHVNSELKPMLDSFKGGGLVANQFTLTESAKQLKADKKEAKAFQMAVAAGASEGIENITNSASTIYQDAMVSIIGAISKRTYSDVKPLFTESGWRLFNKLTEYGKVKLLGKATPDTYSFYPFRDQVMCRSIPMSFSVDKGNRTFTEDVTFTFNKEGKVESIGFGLGSIARKDIFAKEGKAWTDDKKMVLVNFLENYRTAFALRELEYIESIFDDDAVIIVGNVTKKLEKVKGTSGDAVGFATKEHVSYAQKSKKEYLEQLRRCFGSQEYINIRFSDTDVERCGIGGETYAMQLKQDYVSKTYGDQGYLFLFVDFNDVDKPLIHIRTWQPERNPELTPNLPPGHPRAGIFSPANF